MSVSNPLKTTPLLALHQSLGGKLVGFAGYQLPLSYSGGGLIAEHHHTRNAASLFDVSHMGQLQLPAAATDVLARLVPAELATIAPQQAKYTMLTNDHGGVIDDCIITNDGERGWFIVINAAGKAEHIAYIRTALTAAGQDTSTLTEHENRALLALQGPAAATVMCEQFPAAAAAAELTFMQSIRISSDYGDCRISRCGYTGEDGFEISVSADNAIELAKQLLASEHCQPAGLGARDSLRLEAGLCLYGNELSNSISPIEAGLLWTIPRARRHADAGYCGATTISAHIRNGAPRRLVALLPQGKVPVRADSTLYHGSEAVGQVTSGSYSPSLSAPIALALIQASVDKTAPLTAVVRNREISCQQTTLPFVAHRYRHSR